MTETVPGNAEAKRLASDSWSAHWLNSSDSGGFILGGNDHGLGARLKTLAAGRVLAADANARFVLIWPVSRHCGSQATDPEQLFAGASIFVPSRSWEHEAWRADGVLQDAGAHWRHYREELLSLRPDACVAFDFTSPNSPDFVRYERQFGQRIGYVGRGYLVSSDAAFRERLGLELNRIRPALPVLERVEAIAGRYDLGNAIGVHVRRGDVPPGARARRCVDEQRYFDFIDGLEGGGERPIFLCTESSAVIERFRLHFGRGRIICRPIAEDHRTSISGLQDAYADMILLSKCAVIAGGFSNFSQVAALMAGTDRVTLTNRRGRGWGRRLRALIRN